MSDEELGREIFGRTFSVPADLAPQVRQYAAGLPTERAAKLQPLLTLLATNPASLRLMDLNPVLQTEDPQLAPVYRLMAGHPDPVARFNGLYSQILVLKDRTAAQALAQLAKMKDLNERDRWAMRNYFHGIGLDPERDDEQEMFRFISTLREPDNGRPPSGSIAPDFEIPTLAGKVLRLADFRGKVVLLHFWDTTCGPCLGDFPNLQKEIHRWKRKYPDFEVLGVSLDDNLTAVKRCLAKYDLNWITVCDGRGWGSLPAKRFHVSGIPQDVVIARDGRVAGYSRGVLDQVLENRPSPGNEPVSPLAATNSPSHGEVTIKMVMLEAPADIEITKAAYENKELEKRTGVDILTFPALVARGQTVTLGPLGNGVEVARAENGLKTRVPLGPIVKFLGQCDGFRLTWIEHATQIHVGCQPNFSPCWQGACPFSHGCGSVGMSQFGRDCEGDDHSIIEPGEQLDGLNEHQIANRARVSNNQNHFADSVASDWRSISRSASVYGRVASCRVKNASVCQ